MLDFPLHSRAHITCTSGVLGRRILLCPCRSVRHSKVPLTRAARSSGGEEREEALRQQWRESAPEELDEGPYGGPQWGNQQYYQEYPGYRYAPPPESKSGVPWGWLALGAVSAIIVSKIWEFFSPANGGPQAKLMKFVMNQAMKSSGGAGGVPPGFPDFSNMPQAGNFPSSNFSGLSSSSDSSKSSSPIFDTQAKAVETGATQSTASAATSGKSDAPRPGAKFEEMKSSSRRRKRAEQSGGTSTRAAFTDVDEEERASSSSGQAVDPDRVTPPPSSGSGDSMAMLDTFLQDPKMQEMLYQYMPEPMRNKETFKYMLENKEYRAQLEELFKNQGQQMAPDVFQQMQNINSDEVTRQLAEVGMTPTDVVQKIMSQPDLAAAFAKPQVQQAILELQKDPMAILKYQNDPEVMLVFEKMSQLFPGPPPQPGQ